MKDTSTSTQAKSGGRDIYHIIVSFGEGEMLCDDIYSQTVKVAFFKAHIEGWMRNTFKQHLISANLNFIANEGKRISPF